MLNSIAGQCDIVFGFDPALGGVTSYFADPTRAVLNNLTTVQATKGYWVHSLAAGTLSLTGAVPVAPVSLPLPHGWNLIGYVPQASADIVTALNGTAGSITIVYGFDPARGCAVSYFTDPSRAVLNNLTNLSPGHGYWMYNAGNASIWAQ